MSKKKLTDVGKTVPANFKFGLIVAMAIFWTEFIRELIMFVLEDMLHESYSPVLVSLAIAIFFSLLTYFILNHYRKIKNKLKKIEIDND